MALTASLVGRGTTGGNSVTTAAATSASTATFAALVSYDSTAGTITTATDNKGNTYTAVGTPQADTFGGLLRWYVCENGTGGAGHTFTFTTSGPCYAVAHLMQIVGSAGIPRLDVAVRGQDNVGQPWDTVATGTLGYTNEVILAACASQVGAAAYTSANTTILSSEGDTTNFWTSGVGAASLATTASFSPSFARADGGGSTQAGLSHVTFREESTGGGSGSLAATMGAVTIAAAGLLAIAGGVSQTMGSATLSAAGNGPNHTGSVSATMGSATLSSAGQLPITGATSQTVGAATLSAAGTIGVPTLGAHALYWQEESLGFSPAVTAPITTQALGSTFITFAAGYSSNNAGPTDSKSNTYLPYGSQIYRGWSGVFDVRGYVAANGAGGSGHTVSFIKTGNPAGEITIPFVEVANSTGVVDWATNYPAAGATATSASVTTSGPAVLVAFWWGDAGGLTHTATPNNGFTVIEAFGSLPPFSAVQCFVASKSVGAGSHNVTWTQSPSQGAALWLFAVDTPEAGGVGNVSATMGTATLSAVGRLAIAGSVGVTMSSSLSAAGALAISGATSATMGTASLASVGLHGITGTAAATMGGVTLSGQGVLPIAGAVSSVMGTVSLDSSGTHAEVRTGSVDAVMGSATLASAGSLAVRGTLAATMGSAALSSDGALPISGQAAATMGAVALSSAGRLAVSGSLAATMGTAELSATGGVQTDRTGSVSAIMGEALLSATGQASQPGSGMHTYNDVLFRLQFPAFANTTTYPEALLSMYFTQATCYINAYDHCRLNGDCLQLALNLMTAHLAALNALDPSGGGGVGAVSSATIDKVSVTTQIPTAATAFRQFLIRTGFGQQLSALLSIKAVGGFMIGGSQERGSIRQAGGRYPGVWPWAR